MGLLILAIIILLAVKFLAGHMPQAAGTTAYRRERFMSDAETRFFQALHAAVGAQARIFVKPRLRDLVSAIDSNRSRWQARSNQLNMKHVDFLLCDPLTLSPACVIELDDSSHERGDRQARDNFVNEVLKSAGIPIAHFAVRSAYTAEEISSKLAQFLPGQIKSQAEPLPKGLPAKSRAVLIPTDPPPLSTPKDLKYMPPSLRAELEKQKGA
jgi:hypothetical protein